MCWPFRPSKVPSPRASKFRAISGLAFIASRVWRISADPDAYCSKHPRIPHPHKCPSGTILICPSSAPIPKAPRNSDPPSISPPPTPVPKVNNIKSLRPRPAPNLNSPQAAALASFSRTIRFPRISVNSWSKSTPFHPAMFGVAKIVFRSDEINPAADTPIASLSNSRPNSFATSAIAWVRARPPSRGVSRRAVARISPVVLTTPPRTLVPPTSMPMVLEATKLSFYMFFELLQRAINSWFLLLGNHHRRNRHW